MNFERRTPTWLKCADTEAWTDVPLGVWSAAQGYDEFRETYPLECGELLKDTMNFERRTPREAPLRLSSKNQPIAPPRSSQLPSEAKLFHSFFLGFLRG